MKEVTSSTWSFQMILLFILIFACFLSLVLTYSKAYAIKNKMLTIIEQHEGIDVDAANLINSYATGENYKTTSKCPTEEGWMGAINMKGDYETVKENSRYYYCFQETEASNGRIYYNVRLFYNFNLPFLGDIATFKINGETKTFIGNPDRIKGE